MALDPNKVTELYANKRVRGWYLRVFKQQLAGDENGFAAKETYPRLEAKAVETIYQGFRGAAEKELGQDWQDTVDILNSDGDVYVIFKDRVDIVEA